MSTDLVDEFIAADVATRALEQSLSVERRVIQSAKDFQAVMDAVALAIRLDRVQVVALLESFGVESDFRTNQDGTVNFRLKKPDGTWGDWSPNIRGGIGPVGPSITLSKGLVELGEDPSDFDIAVREGDDGEWFVDATLPPGLPGTNGTDGTDGAPGATGPAGTVASQAGSTLFGNPSGSSAGAPGALSPDQGRRLVDIHHVKRYASLIDTDDPQDDPDTYTTDFYDSARVYGSGAVFRKAASEPSHPGKRQNANGTWYELAEAKVNQFMFGAVGSSASVGSFGSWTDDTQAFLNMELYCRATGAIVEAVPGRHKIISTIEARGNGEWHRAHFYVSSTVFAAAGDKVPFRLGRATADRLSNVRVSTPQVTNVDHVAGDNFTGYTDVIAVQLGNLNFSKVKVAPIYGFGIGLQLRGYGTVGAQHGCANNEVEVMSISSNKIGIDLFSDGTHGWCNQNEIQGGNVGMGAGEHAGTPISGSMFIRLRKDASNVNSAPNNNYIDVNFEGIEVDVSADVQGRITTFGPKCRWEHTNAEIVERSVVAGETHGTKIMGGYDAYAVVWTKAGAAADAIYQTADNAHSYNKQGYQATMKLATQSSAGDASLVLGFDAGVNPAAKAWNAADWVMKLQATFASFKRAADANPLIQLQYNTGAPSLSFGDGTAAPQITVAYSAGGLTINAALIPTTTNSRDLGTASLQFKSAYLAQYLFFGGTIRWSYNNGSPESVITSTIGGLVVSSGNGSLYTKRTGTGTTGWDRLASTRLAIINTDADFTLTPHTDAPTQKHTGTQTADRTITLSSTGADVATQWFISKTGFNFNLILGSTGASLGYGEWAILRWDGSAYYVAARGRTDTTVAFSGAASPTPTAFGYAQFRTGDMTLAAGDGSGTRYYAALPANFAANDLLFGASAYALSRLAFSANGKILGAVGGVPAWVDPPAQMTLSAKQVTTSGTAFDFTGIPSWAKRIEILFDSVSLSGSDRLLVQIGPTAGMEVTGYNSGTTRASTPTSTAGFIVLSNAAGELNSGIMTLLKVEADVWVESHVIWQQNGSDIAHGGGRKSVAGPVTQLRVTQNGTNTFDGGAVAIQVYG